MYSKDDSVQSISGIITAAMAWRVKYRKLDDNGKVVRQHFPIQHLGVHPIEGGRLPRWGQMQELGCRLADERVCEGGVQPCRRCR